MNDAYLNELNKARSQQKQLKKKLQKIGKKNSTDLDKWFLENHNNAFENIDCLECANCCKTTSPIFYDKDIERLSNRLKMKASDFYQKYLKTDQEGDQVLQSSPCPFLLEDNKCAVYEDRPKACREYPHTNRKRMHQILDLTLRNTKVCPAVARIVDGIGS